MANVKFNNRSYFYDEYGSGEPLLLIAGLASDSQSWLTVIIGLSKHFRVIILDNRGVGRSDKDNTDITVPKMTDDCIALLRHLKLSTVNVIGHSMGGMIAMDMAIRYPEFVGKLILEATSPAIGMRNIELFNDMVSFRKLGMDKDLWFRNIFYWIFAPSFFNDVAMLKQYVSMAVNYKYIQSDSSFENQVKAISVFNCTADINNIQQPTLVVFGEVDLLFPSAETLELFDKITHLQTVTIPKAAHSIHMDNPDDFMKNVIEFLLDDE
ncbi:MAG: alpha/beta hydrolase [Bacteroidota bacterium]